MQIPHAERAEVDIRKLIGYCLSLEHAEGKHKARLFAEALGITADDAGDLRDALLKMIKTQDAKLGLRDDYGQRYTVDFLIEWQGKQAMIRSGWIIEHDSDTPAPDDVLSL